MDISQTTVESKTKFKLPENATILKKETRIRVEEIENGYLIRKSYEIKWQDESGETRWDNFDKSWYSKVDPIKITTPKDINLADNF